MKDYRSRIVRSTPDQIRVGDDAARLSGLTCLIETSRGLSVFDIGCHDGTVLRAFERAGASPLAGCDIHDASLAIARERMPFAQIERHDLMQGPPVINADIVLYLGVHHHLQEQGADAGRVARTLADGARVYFAVRAPIVALDDVSSIAHAAGQTLWYEDASSQVVSPLRVFRRVEG